MTTLRKLVWPILESVVWMVRFCRYFVGSQAYRGAEGACCGVFKMSGVHVVCLKEEEEEEEGKVYSGANAVNEEERDRATRRSRRRGGGKFKANAGGVGGGHGLCKQGSCYKTMAPESKKRSLGVYNWQ